MKIYAFLKITTYIRKCVNSVEFDVNVTVHPNQSLLLYMVLQLNDLVTRCKTRLRTLTSSFYLCYMYEPFVCLHVCECNICALCLQRPEEGVKSLGTGSTDVSHHMILGTEPHSSTRTASAYNDCDNSPVPLLHF